MLSCELDRKTKTDQLQNNNQKKNWWLAKQLCVNLQYEHTYYTISTAIVNLLAMLCSTAVAFFFPSRLPVKHSYTTDALFIGLTRISSSANFEPASELYSWVKKS